MLVILTVLSALVAYVHVWLLKVFVKPVMLATSVFIPATLFVSAVCAFVGSFMWDGDMEPTWGESVGYVITFHVFSHYWILTIFADCDYSLSYP